MAEEEEEAWKTGLGSRISSGGVGVGAEGFVHEGSWERRGLDLGGEESDPEPEAARRLTADPRLPEASPKPFDANVAALGGLVNAWNPRPPPPVASSLNGFGLALENGRVGLEIRMLFIPPAPPPTNEDVVCLLPPEAPSRRRRRHL